MRAPRRSLVSIALADAALRAGCTLASEDLIYCDCGARVPVASWSRHRNQDCALARRDPQREQSA